MSPRWVNRFTLVLFCLAIVAIVMVTRQMRQERDREAKSEHGDV